MLAMPGNLRDECELNGNPGFDGSIIGLAACKTAPHGFGKGKGR